MTLANNSDSERQEQKVYEELIKTVPGIEERLLKSSEDEIMYIADQASHISP